MSIDASALRQPMLLVGPEHTCRRLAGALALLGYRGLPAGDADAALRALAGVGIAVASGVISSELPEPAALLREIQASLAAPLVWTLWGVRPEEAAAARLRQENVRFALVEPITAEDLRFVLAESHRVDADDSSRIESRVPTSMRARVVTKTGERVAVVCNLSGSGAYLATPRPALRGGRVEVELPLPDLPIRTEAEVLWNNVPGNLRRANAPIGMGVRFLALAPDAIKALRDYLDARAASYRL